MLFSLLYILHILERMAFLISMVSGPGPFFFPSCPDSTLSSALGPAFIMLSMSLWCYICRDLQFLQDLWPLRYSLYFLLLTNTLPLVLPWPYIKFFLLSQILSLCLPFSIKPVFESYPWVVSLNFSCKPLSENPPTWHVVFPALQVHSCTYYNTP